MPDQPVSDKVPSDESKLQNKQLLIIKALHGFKRGYYDNDKNGDVIEIRRLLQVGADPNETDSRGSTAIHAVVSLARNHHSFNHRTILQDLLSAGASPDITNKYGQTPLLLASSSYHYTIRWHVEKLIAAGADVNKTDPDGNTSLHHAACFGNMDLVCILLSAGALTDPVDHMGCTPLLLLMCNPEEIPDGHRLRVIQQLIAAGANVNAEVKSRDPRDPTWVARSLLSMACFRGDSKTVELLLSNGVSLDSITRIGGLSIFWATNSNNVKLVQQLIDAGFDINFIDRCRRVKFGQHITSMETTLMVAIENDNVEMVKFLLEQGADPNKASSLGQSVLYDAVKKNSRKNLLPILKLLLSYGADLHDGGIRNTQSPFELLVTKFRAAETLFCLQHGLDLRRYNPRSPEDFSPLHHAVSSLWSPDTLLSHLLEYNTGGLLDLEHLDKYGYSPLCVATQNGNISSVRLLLNSGADVNHATLEDRSPLELAASSNKRFNSDMIELLLRRYLEKCKAEIEKLKSAMLNDSISCYDLLIADKDFGRRVRDDRVYEAFDNYKDSFPIFFRDLEKIFKTAKYTHEVWEKSVNKLSEYLGFDRDAYYLLIYNILKYLEFDSLRSVAKS
ncbi:hypothetical protein QAD02_015059 [Eretmocerus hayati]|uniref:Uncharacterized protein n=1 Tax=Eretmocerus hayati TaxID=131215 RepID=A0ACC2P9Z7_9HYME|nr:hypothetical protein QAD02_015059 [Eretmocerus hayati]